MNHRESAAREEQERRASTVGSLRTPIKRPPKPDTFSASKVEDSFEKARLAGLTYSARTIHPNGRHTESICPTPGQWFAETPCSRVTVVTINPGGLDPVDDQEAERPSLPPPLQVHSPVHALPCDRPRTTQLYTGSAINLHPVREEEDKELLNGGEYILTPGWKGGRKAEFDSRAGMDSVNSGTIAARLMSKFLEDDATKDMGKRLSTAHESPRKSNLG